MRVSGEAAWGLVDSKLIKVCRQVGVFGEAHLACRYRHRFVLLVRVLSRHLGMMMLMLMMLMMITKRERAQPPPKLPSSFHLPRAEHSAKCSRDGRCRPGARGLAPGSACICLIRGALSHCVPGSERSRQGG